MSNASVNRQPMGGTWACQTSGCNASEEWSTFKEGKADAQKHADTYGHNVRITEWIVTDVSARRT